MCVRATNLGPLLKYNNIKIVATQVKAESVKSKKDIFMASKLALGGALKSREASNVMILPI